MTDLGKVCYNSWVREAGFGKDARVMDYSKLATYMQARWRTIARDIIKANEANHEQRTSAEYTRRVHAEVAHIRKKETTDAKPTRTRAKKPRRTVSRVAKV
jgi:hypothetical protein